MVKPENKIGVNRHSPPSEPKYVRTYRNVVNVTSDKHVSAVNVNGVPGYGLLPPKINQSRDREPHRIEKFISSEDLRKEMNS
jgi:hypothetical protein